MAEQLELVVSTGEGAGRVIPLAPRPVVLGSGPAADHLLEAPGVLARHVELHVDPSGAVRVAGLGPIRLDGREVTEGVLRPGEFLQVGTVELVLRERTRVSGPAGTLTTPVPSSLTPTRNGRGGPQALAETAVRSASELPWPDEQLSAGTVVDGRYALLERVGRGGMGEVYRARHVELGKVLALKVMRPELSGDPGFVARFRREASAASRVGHPNIADVSDFGRTADGRFYFAMEFVQGETLADLVRRTGALPLERAVALCSQVASALAAAHAEGIIHRDLKPENVMVERGSGGPGRVKLLDFGVAKVGHGPSPSGDTALGVVVGTPQYMSPEQAQGLPSDARSDVYALGLILHELLTGKPTFEADTPSMLMVKQVTEPPPRFQGALAASVPAALNQLVFQMLSKDPGARPQQMAEVRDALEGCLARAAGHFAWDGRKLRVAALVFAGTMGFVGWRAAQRLEIPARRAALAVDHAAAEYEPMGNGSAFMEHGPPPPSKVDVERDGPPVKLTLVSDATAQVFEKGVLLGTTPLALVRPRNSRMSVVLRAPGRIDVGATFDFVSEAVLNYPLPESDPAKRQHPPQPLPQKQGRQGLELLKSPY